MDSTFGTALAVKLAASLTKDLVASLAGSIRKKLGTAAAQKAVEEAVRLALERSLEKVATPLALADHGEDGRRHFEDLLCRLLGHGDIVDELAKVIDPRPDVEIDVRRLVAEMKEEGFESEHFPDFDLAPFLGDLMEELAAALAQRTELQRVVEIRLLGKLVGSSERTARAAESSATRLKEISESVRALVEGQPVQLFLNVVQVYLEKGLPGAYQGYEALMAALNEEGLDAILDPAGDALTVTGTPRHAESGLPSAGRAALERAARELREVITGVPVTDRELDAFETRYREHLVRWLEKLSFQGMMQAPKPILLPLEEVYVELRAVAEVPESADAFSVEERRLLLGLHEEDLDETGRRRELTNQLDALRRERWSATLPERKSIAEALHRSDEHAFVVIGDPGSGKTTLLHYLALVYARGAESAARRLSVPDAEADRLPILVPLAAYDDMRSKRPGLTIPEFLPLYYDVRRGLPGLGPLFDRAIDSGRALVLLDGLDEVIDVTTRRLVAEQVAALIGEWTRRGVRFVLSSRVVGYREAPIVGKVSTLTVLDFGEPEITVFVRQWAKAYETWAADGETPEALRLARALERDLRSDVRSNPSVRRLAANPLMLTMLALLRRQVGKLPHRRVQLYESYVGAVLESWIEARSPGAREASLPRIDRYQAENVLIPLALWLQETKPSGTAGRHEIREKLAEIYLEDEGLSSAGGNTPQMRLAEERAERFLREMRVMSGLIVERGHDAHGFLHLTFQEYFAGRALARATDEKRWEMVRRHLHEPRWREPLMLCAGRLGVVENRRQQATSLVRRILEAEDPTEKHLHRNLLLALAIACDDVNLEPQLITQLVESTLGCLTTNVFALAQVLLRGLTQLVANGAIPLTALDSALESGDDMLVAIALEELGRATQIPAIRQLLLGYLADESWEDVAIRALANRVESDADLRAALLQRLDAGQSHIRRRAAAALSQAASDPEVRASLLRALDDSEWEMRQVAVVALSSRVKSDAEIQAALRRRIEDASHEVRAAAIEALSDEIGSDPQIRAALLEKLLDAPVARTVLRALAAQAPHSAEVRAALLRGLNSGRLHVRHASVAALADLVKADPEARAAALRRLDDASDAVRSAALDTLAAAFASDPAVPEAFRTQARSNEWRVRRTVAEAVGGRPALTVRLDLLSTILRDASAPEAVVGLAFAQRRPVSQVIQAVRVLAARNPFDGESVAKALSNRWPNDRGLQLAWLGLLDDMDDTVRSVAVSALSTYLTRDDSEVRDAVCARLADSGASVRAAAASALSGQVGSDDDIRVALLACLEDGDVDVCVAAVSALASLVTSDREIRSALEAKLKSDEIDIRLAAIQALTSQVENNPAIRSAALAMLKDGDEETRLLAVDALAGLAGSDTEIRAAVLSKLESGDEVERSVVARALASQAGNVAEIRSALHAKLKDEDGFMRSVAISALSSQVGGDREARAAVIASLGDTDAEVRTAALRALSVYAAGDAEIRTEFTKLLSDNDSYVSMEVLKALLSGHPSDSSAERELRGCLEWISVDSSSSHWPAKTDDMLTFRARMADRLATHAAAIPGVLEILRQRLRDARWTARLGAALALLVWPNSNELHREISRALEDDSGLESYPARLTAASYLINRNEYCDECVDLCLEALDYGTRRWEFVHAQDVRRQAASVLGSLEPLRYEPRVYEKLVDVMRYDAEWPVRDGAYRALVRLARARDERSGA